MQATTETQEALRCPDCGGRVDATDPDDVTWERRGGRLVALCSDCAADEDGLCEWCGIHFAAGRYCSPECARAAGSDHA